MRPVRDIVESYNAADPWTMPTPFPHRGTPIRESPNWSANASSGAPGRWWPAVDQLRRPGQYVTTRVGGRALVIVCDNSGVLRGFYNVCRHHAAAVMTEPEGHASIFRCPYHGWSYGLDGALKGAPEFEGVCGFDRAQNGLLPLRVETWEQFVFVKLDPKACPWPISSEGWRSGLPRSPLASLHFFERRSYTLELQLEGVRG